MISFITIIFTVKPYLIPYLTHHLPFQSVGRHQRSRGDLPRVRPRRGQGLDLDPAGRVHPDQGGRLVRPPSERGRSGHSALRAIAVQEVFPSCLRALE